MMPKLIQINERLNFSIGKIAQQLDVSTISVGWDRYIAYSSREKALRASLKLSMENLEYPHIFIILKEKSLIEKGWYQESAQRSS